MNSKKHELITVRNDTAGILQGDSANADWKKTLERANRLFRERQEGHFAEREERERGRTVPEWRRYLEPPWS
ncbi:MAG: hypothetical protein AAF558_00015 [Verrucomicrobiota bacterium]